MNTLLGAWLLVSVLLWRHRGPEGFDAILTGLLVLTVAPISVWAPRLLVPSRPWQYRRARAEA